MSGDAGAAGGDIQMNPGATSRVLDNVQRQVDSWSNGWSGMLSTIHATEVAVHSGFDDVSIAFRQTYNEVEPDLSAAVGMLGPNLLAAIKDGRAIVKRHVEVFEQGAELLDLE
jgi:hypothetical protein